ncbi:Gfo/Idh/MocA family protein [Halobaculum sp. MBLA0143]|uniref:Gfo/Idh/MocA family protein n=1 Tax=Halobaculum sp. MBLA0143 TaxID=3079933 RepID=UPI003526A3B7
MTETRVGIVGLGGIAHHHAERLVETDARLVGGMDVAESARERFGDTFDVVTFADAAPLFEQIDAVVVTTPNRFHEEYAVAALEAGLDVLIEKPLAHTVDSAERIAAAAREAPGFLVVGFNNRFAPPVEVLHDRVAAGELGEITHVEANYVRRRGVPGRGSWFTDEAVAGGGALVDLGVHAVDLALHLAGFPAVREVSGVTRSEFGGDEEYAYLEMWGDDDGPEAFDVEDSASAFLRFDGGTTVSLEAAWAVNRPPTQEFFVRGTDGGARFDRATGELTLFDAGTDGGHHLADTEIRTRDGDSHRAEQRAFLEAVRAGEAPERNTVAEGLAVQRVLSAIYESDESGSAVEL